ncbi:RNA polymerase sigma factor [Streptomyces sp. NEAU-Y11]|uniref:RNA polymerase sigma factor n=1 Tax=Streptomyces cucumeris TaxID=2962890 RepID=UPI0020C852D4|nr:sigma-70 family RNA polymerase sigma factor [Streptomyces sp. NEAU-Y11]MCP9212467.1 sigma-70 family RNA polymerase sigma factor [Streptomyces sp. NEAU-Y11]
MGQRGSVWFEGVYREHRHQVWRYLMRRMPERDAEDALAEVFSQAWASRHSLRGPALPWLYGIARHVVARTLAHVHRGTGSPTPVTLPVADSAEEQTAARSGALAALGCLSDAEREAVLLIAWEGLSPAHAARAAGCSTPAMTLRLHRARRRLERELGEAT